MLAEARRFARRTGQTMLAVGAAVMVCILSGLALILTLACAPPLKRLAKTLADPDDRAP